MYIPETEFESKRLFIAFKIPESYANKLLSESKKLDSSVWNVTDNNNLHITLLWLGDVPTFIIPDVIKILENITENINPISLNRAKAVIMMPQSPYMVWARYDKNKWFESLVLSIEKYFWKIGTWKNLRDRKQRKQSGEKITIPHITLARVKGREHSSSLICPIEIPDDMDSVKLSQIVLYESILNNRNEDTHNYIEVASFDLSKNKG